MKLICNICSTESVKIFDALILNKYKVNYYQCRSCSFIQTESPYWLSEAYVSAITALDIGLIYRNMLFSKIIPPILDVFSKQNDSYIDYGGGYGMFVRIMRDLGYDYYLQDMYAENMYAKHFEIRDYKGQNKFACLTAFEVFEHLENPVQELDKMFGLSDTIIFSTELQPASSFGNVTNWWYFLPEIGQHISLYSTKSLVILSEKHKCKMYSNGHDLHMLTKRDFIKDPLLGSTDSKRSILSRGTNKLINLLNPERKVNERPSLLWSDFEFYKSKLSNT